MGHSNSAVVGSSTIAAASVYPDIPGPYSFEELGLDVAVDDAVREQFPLVGYRTVEELTEALISEFEDQVAVNNGNDTDVPVQRFFDVGVTLLLTEGAHTHSPEFVQLEQEAQELHVQRTLNCARASAAGIDEQSLFLSAPSAADRVGKAEYEAHARSFGLTTNELLDVRHGCSKQAMSTEGPLGQRMGVLLQQMHEMHTAALVSWLERNPDIIPPDGVIELQ